MTETSTLNLSATAAVKHAQETWIALVDMALLLPEERVDGAAAELSKHMGQSKDNLKRKILAIQHARALSHTPEEIKKAGQGATLSRYFKKTNSDKYETTTVMKWQLPGSLREITRQNMAQVAKILDLHTSEELWDFLNSILGDLVRHPEDLKHLAGELRGK